METAFTVPEILEQILLRLDMRTLLTSAQRVCVRWRNMIAESLIIQQALFFKPVQNASSAFPFKTPNPLLAELFAPWFISGRTHALSPQDMPMAADGRNKAAFLRGDASWQRMLVRQPPVFSLLLVQGSDEMAGTGYRVSSLTLKDGKENGLRMGSLYDLTWEIDSVYFEPVWQVCWVGDDDDEETTKALRSAAELLGETAREAEAVVVSRHTQQCYGGFSTEQFLWRKEFKRERMEPVVTEKEFGIFVDGGYRLEIDMHDDRQTLSSEALLGVYSDLCGLGTPNSGYIRAESPNLTEEVRAQFQGWVYPNTALSNLPQ
jgi:hypothetical protein